MVAGAIRKHTEVTAGSFSRKMAIMTHGQSGTRDGLSITHPQSLSGGCSHANFLTLQPAEELRVYREH